MAEAPRREGCETARGDPAAKKAEKSGAANLQEIPGVGPSIALDLNDLGFRSVGDLRGRDPERMYADLCRLRGSAVDRCVLYVFRCAVYYAGRSRRNPGKLLWWNWKEGPARGREGRKRRRGGAGG